jgi:PAS domain S-box-containing protein
MQKVSTKRNVKELVVQTSIVLTILVIIFGFFFTQIVVDYGKKQLRQNLIDRTITAAFSFDPADIAYLDGNPKNIDNSFFKGIRSQLIRIKNANKDVRFIYFMAKKNSKIIFLVDAESTTSKDYSAPGDVYDEASPELKNIFTTGIPFIEGPLKDQWGIWVSCIAPIRNPKTNEIIAVIGIDIDAQDWQNSIGVYRWFSFSISVLIFLIAFISSLALFQISDVNRKLITEIEERHLIEMELFLEKEKAQKYLDVAEVMMVVLNSEGVITLINKKGCSILKVIEEDVLGKNWFDNFIHPEVVEEVKGVFNSIMDRDIEHVKFYVNQILTSDGKERMIAFHNAILTDKDNNLTGVLFSAEDITERKLAEEEREKLIKELQTAITEIKTLRGILPFCCVCGLIRDDTGVEHGEGDWMKVDKYVVQKTDAKVSHTYCPNCFEEAVKKEGL